MSGQIPGPIRAYRVINGEKWEWAMRSIIFGNFRLNHMIVEWTHTGWVYIVTVDANRVFSCLTYKIRVNPEGINDLHNFTIINGNLVKAQRYSYIDKTFSRL